MLLKKYGLTTFFSVSIALAGTTPSRLFTVETGNTTSPYTAKLIDLLKNVDHARQFCPIQSKTQDITTIGLRTEGRPYYVGFKKCMWINAPLEAVASVIDDIDHYHVLFPGSRRVTVMHRTTDESILEWERTIPLFFVPNVEYQISYFTDKSKKDRILYRYQFKKGDRLKFNDGIEILLAKDKSTLFVNYEFYEADYSVGLFGLQAISQENVWKESLEGSFRSLFAIRLKAEKPTLSYEQIQRESERLLKEVDLNAVPYERSFKID